MPVGCIDITGILITEMEKPKFSFALITRGKTYHLYCKTEHEKVQWVSAIESGIQKAKGAPSPFVIP